MKVEIELSDSMLKAIAAEMMNSLKPVVAAGRKVETSDAIFTPEQLAEYLHVKRQWVYERVSLGEIPYFKLGRFLRFRKSVIDKWIDSQSLLVNNSNTRLLKVLDKKG